MVDPVWAGCSGADPIQAVYAVLNTETYDLKVDQTGILEVPLVSAIGEGPSWKFPSDSSVDLAITSLNGDYFSKLVVEKSPLLVNQLPTKQEIDSVDAGAVIESAGFLLGIAGPKRNYQILHSAMCRK